MKLNSCWKLLLCIVLCFAWIIHPLSSVYAQDETPPPTPAEVTVTEDTNPPVESTPEVVVIAATEAASESVSEVGTVNETTTGLLVQFDAGMSQDELVQSLGQYGVVVQNDLTRINFVLVNVRQSGYESALCGLSNTPGVLLVEADEEMWLEDTIPDDPSFSTQYGLDAINAPQGWDTTTGSSLVTIAVVDSGVDLTHPDLASKFVSGYDFVNNDADPMDDNGHGTHVAGIVAAVTDNGLGVAGVSWGAQIMPVKVLNSGGNGTFTNAAQGIIYAVDHGAQVINLSLGGTTNSSVLQSAIAYAYSHGVVMVAATGNSNSSVLYPAAYPQVIAVAASDQSNDRATFSNYGPEVDVTAPGVAIYSTALGGGYQTRSGTSMATAHVTGEVALLLSMNSGLTPDEVAYIVQSTAVDIGAPGVDDYTGSGLIQVDAAVIALIPTAVPQTASETESEPEEEKPSRRQETALPSPTSSGSPLPMATLPESTSDELEEPELSAQVEVAAGTPMPSTASTEIAPTGTTASSSPFPSFLIGLLAGIIAIVIFFHLRKKNANS